MGMVIGVIFIILSSLVAIAMIIKYPEDMSTFTLGATAGSLLISGILMICLYTITPPGPQQLCEENSISYGLVQAVAEYTDKTEKEVTQFFIIVQDDVEAYEAIQMLDNSLTEKQINAILELGAMKQAE